MLIPKRDFDLDSEDDDFSSPDYWGRSSEATAIRCGILFGILGLALVVIVGSYFHAQHRLKRGLAPLVYHRVGSLPPPCDYFPLISLPTSGLSPSPNAPSTNLTCESQSRTSRSTTAVPSPVRPLPATTCTLFLRPYITRMRNSRQCTCNSLRRIPGSTSVRRCQKAERIRF